jgi:hypothetical protein
VFREAACAGLPALVSGDRRSALENIGGEPAAGCAGRRRDDRLPLRLVPADVQRNIPLLFKEGHPLHDDAAFVAERATDYAASSSTRA